MLEGPAFLVSRDLPSACEQECKWAYNAFCVTEFQKKNVILMVKKRTDPKVR
ncbi:hypothetical protein HanIR_Chr04g0171051 [Helianthus annuus]|nr:hypothetical protein HanIR_Chr04g0171051 [Helianthus annuus]